MEDSQIVMFGQAYAHIHGYISLGICVLSILVNTANVVVLTRRKMWSASNLLLTAIAFADILKMTSYCAFAVRFGILSRVNDPQPLAWMVFLIGHTHFVLVLHAITTWLTVTLAVFRYCIICTKRGVNRITIEIAKLTILVAASCSVLMYIPQYVAIRIMPHVADGADASQSQSQNGSTIEDEQRANGSLAATVHPLGVDVSEVQFTYTDGNSVLYNLSHIIHGPVLKLLASVLITVPTAAVISKMRRAAERHASMLHSTSSRRHNDGDSSPKQLSECASKRLKLPEWKRTAASRLLMSMPDSNNSRSSYVGSVNSLSRFSRSVKSRSSVRAERNHRTTLMLVAVVITFVAVELPQGVILLIGCFSTYFQEVVYYRLSDFVDLLVLLYSAINFILYCSMSQQFRTVFSETFVLPIKRCICPSAKMSG